MRQRGEIRIRWGGSRGLRVSKALSRSALPSSGGSAWTGADGRDVAGKQARDPGAFLSRTDLAELGLPRRAVDAIFRACPAAPIRPPTSSRARPPHRPLRPLPVPGSGRHRSGPRSLATIAGRSGARVGLLRDLLRIAWAFPYDDVVAAGIDDVFHGLVVMTRAHEEEP
jgi:hypothetical protein